MNKFFLTLLNKELQLYSTLRTLHKKSVQVWHLFGTSKKYFFNYSHFLTTSGVIYLSFLGLSSKATRHFLNLE